MPNHCVVGETVKMHNCYCSARVAVICGLVFLAGESRGQTFYESIAGTVTDSSKAIMEGATVTW